MIDVLYAALIVGIVLIEAVLLYLGYGYVEDLVAPVVFRLLAGDRPSGAP